MSFSSWTDEHLIPEWRMAKHWWSVRWNAVGAIILPLMQAVPEMPDTVQQALPVAVRATIAALWCMIAIYFRVYAQKAVPPPCSDDDK